MLNSVTKITGANCLPNMLTLDKKNAEELRNLRIVQVQWYFSYTLDFTLNDGQTLKTGTTRDFYNGHTFDRNKKITKVEVVISNDKRGVLQIKGAIDFIVVFARTFLYCKINLIGLIVLV